MPNGTNTRGKQTPVSTPPVSRRGSATSNSASARSTPVPKTPAVRKLPKTPAVGTPAVRTPASISYIRAAKQPKKETIKPKPVDEESARRAIGDIPYLCMDYSNEQKDIKYKEYLDRNVVKGLNLEEYKRKFSRILEEIKLEGLSKIIPEKIQHNGEDFKVFAKEDLSKEGELVKAIFYKQKIEGLNKSAKRIELNNSSTVKSNKQIFGKYCEEFSEFLENKINKGEEISLQTVKEYQFKSDNNSLDSASREFFENIIKRTKEKYNDIPFGFYSSVILSEIRLAGAEINKLELEKQNHRIISDIGASKSDSQIQDELLDPSSVQEMEELHKASNELFKNNINYLAYVHFTQVEAILGGGISIALTKPSTNPINIDPENAPKNGQGQLIKIDYQKIKPLSRDQNLAATAVNSALSKRNRTRRNLFRELLFAGNNKKLSPKVDNVLGTGGGKSYLSEIFDQIFDKEKLGEKKIVTLDSSKGKFEEIAASQKHNIHLDEAYFYPLKEEVRTKIPNAKDDAKDRVEKIKESYRFRRDLRKEDRGNFLVTWGASANPIEMKIACLRNKEKWHNLEDQISDCSQISREYDLMQDKRDKISENITSKFGEAGVKGAEIDYDLEIAITKYKKYRRNIDNFFSGDESSSFENMPATTQKLLNAIGISSANNDEYQKIQSQFGNFKIFWELGKIRLDLIKYYEYKIKILISHGVNVSNEENALKELRNDCKALDLFIKGESEGDLKELSKKLSESSRKFESIIKKYFYKELELNKIDIYKKNAEKLEELIIAAKDRQNFERKKEAAYFDLHYRRDVTPPLMWFGKKVDLSGLEPVISDASEDDKKRYKSSFSSQNVGPVGQKRNLGQIIAHKLQRLEDNQRMQYMLPQLKTEDLFSGGDQMNILKEIQSKSGADVIIIPAVIDSKAACRIYKKEDNGEFKLSDAILTEELRKKFERGEYKKLEKARVLAIFTENSIGGDYANFSTGITHQTVHLQNLDGITWNEIMQFNRNRDGDPNKIDAVQRSFVIDQDITKEIVVQQISAATIQLDREYAQAYVATKSEDAGDQIEKLNEEAVKFARIQNNLRDDFFLNGSEEEHDRYFEARKKLREQKQNFVDEVEKEIECKYEDLEEKERREKREELNRTLEEIILGIDNNIESLKSKKDHLDIDSASAEVNEKTLARYIELFIGKLNLEKQQNKYLGEEVEKKLEEAFNKEIATFSLPQNSQEIENFKKRCQEKIAEQEKLKEDIQGLLLNSEEDYEVVFREFSEFEHLIKEQELKEFGDELEKHIKQSSESIHKTLESARIISENPNTLLFDPIINEIKRNILLEFADRVVKAKDDVEKRYKEFKEQNNFGKIVWGEFNKKKECFITNIDDVARSIEGLKISEDARGNFNKAIQDARNFDNGNKIDEFITILESIIDNRDSYEKLVDRIKQSKDNLNHKNFKEIKTEVESFEKQKKDDLAKIPEAERKISDLVNYFNAEKDREFEAEINKLKTLRDSLFKDENLKKLQTVEDSLEAKKQKLDKLAEGFIAEKEESKTQNNPEKEITKYKKLSNIANDIFGKLETSAEQSVPELQGLRVKLSLLNTEHLKGCFADFSNSIDTAESQINAAKSQIERGADSILAEVAALKENLNNPNINQKVQELVEKENKFIVDKIKADISAVNQLTDKSALEQAVLVLEGASGEIKKEIPEFLRKFLTAKIEKTRKNLADEDNLESKQNESKGVLAALYLEHDQYLNTNLYQDLEKKLNHVTKFFTEKKLDLAQYPIHDKAKELLQKLAQEKIPTDAIPQYNRPDEYNNLIAEIDEIKDSLAQQHNINEWPQYIDKVNEIIGDSAGYLTANTISKLYSLHAESFIEQKRTDLQKIKDEERNKVEQVKKELDALVNNISQKKSLNKNIADLAELRDKIATRRSDIEELRAKVNEIIVPEKIAENDYGNLSEPTEDEKSRINVAKQAVSDAVDLLNAEFKKAKDKLQEIDELHENLQRGLVFTNTEKINEIFQNANYDEAKSVIETALAEIKQINVDELKNKFNQKVGAEISARIEKQRLEEQRRREEEERRKREEEERRKREEEERRKREEEERRKREEEERRKREQNPPASPFVPITTTIPSPASTPALSETASELSDANIAIQAEQTRLETVKTMFGIFNEHLQVPSENGKNRLVIYAQDCELEGKIITPEILRMSNFAGNQFRFGKDGDDPQIFAAKEKSKILRIKSFDLDGLHFKEDGEGKIFSDVSIYNSNFKNCIFENCDFTKVKNLESARFFNCQFVKCVFAEKIKDNQALRNKIFDDKCKLQDNVSGLETNEVRQEYAPSSAIAARKAFVERVVPEEYFIKK